MISKDEGRYWVTCDVCSDFVEEGCSTFAEAVELKKTCGFRSKKINGEWVDLCPSCQEG